MPDFKKLPTVNGDAVALVGHTHPSSPDELSGLVLWFKADAITGLVDSDPVATWPDSSGNGRDATQATSGKRPLYKLGIINSLPVVRFDGTDDTLATAASAFSASSAVTVIAVAKSGASSGRVWALDHALVSVFREFGNTWSYYANQANAVVPFGGTATDATVISVVYASNASATGYLNGGGAVAFDPNNTFGTTQALALGNSTAAGADYLNGDIAEVVMYNRALSAADRVGLERSLGTKYGITVTGTVDPVTEFATAIKWGTD